MRQQVTVLLISGPFSGRRIKTERVQDYHLVRLPDPARVILVYERDGDSLNYYYNRKLTAAFTKNYDAIGAKIKFNRLDPVEGEKSENLSGGTDAGNP